MKQLKALPDINEVWLDLDGVFADFDWAVYERLGYTCESVSDDVLWADIIAWDNRNKDGWFATLRPMRDAMELWNVVKEFNPKILTATGKSIKDAAKQKTKWVRTHLSNDIEMLFVESGKDKAQFAHATALLIDDRSVSCKPWRQAGGIAIKHKSAVETIAQLENLNIIC